MTARGGDRGPGASNATVSIEAPIARPVWVDRDAGWVVRDLAVAVTDPELVARLGPELEHSWVRTAAVVGVFLVPR